MIDTEALRKKVIDLAIQGKLTEQLPSDGDAESLYAQIQEEKAKLTKEGKIKKEKPLPLISAEEIPFEIPRNWKWIRLAALYNINPKVEADNNAKAAFIPMELISAGFSKDFSYVEQEWSVASKNHTRFQNDDVAFAKISPCFENRKSFIASNLPNGIGGGTTELIILRQKYVLPEYTLYVVLDQRFIDAGSMSYKGIVGQQRIKSDIVDNYLVALPPLAEQKRIVKKLDTVLEQIDIIDTLQQKYESDLSVLNGKIIDAGIRGKLTEQLPEDGDAETLYSQIQEEKAKLIKEGKIKKEKPLPEISSDEIPFEIPKNWKWVRWGELSEKIQYGYNAPAKQTGRIKMVRISDIQDGKVQWDTVPYCNIEDKDIPDYLLCKDDILFARTGGTVGKSYIVSEVPEEAIYAGYLIRTSYSSNICASYMKYFMESYLYWKQLQSGTIATAQPNCNGKTLSKMIVPLPPYSEQNRISKKIDELLDIIS